jgi:acyl-CoA synthetase (AMP-forming)/AMP-acid ligase II
MYLTSGLHRSVQRNKCPKSIEFRTAMPLSAAGKVLKSELRKPYRADHQP